MGTEYYYWFKSVDFSGNASAEAGPVGPVLPLQTNTGDVEDYAINLPAVAQATGALSTPQGQWTNVLSVGIVSTGAPILIQGYVETYLSGGSNHRTKARLRRGASTTIWEAYAAQSAASGDINPQTVLFREQPGAGSYTYYLDVYVTGENGVNAYTRGLVLTEVKK
ncbi:MAG: hypothetical protein Kow0025_21040 [Thermodesulfovibrionales bacterium]